MIAVLLIFTSVYLAVRIAMAELAQSLQNIYTRWEERAKPKIKHLAATTQNCYSSQSQTFRRRFSNKKSNFQHAYRPPSCRTNGYAEFRLKYSVAHFMKFSEDPAMMLGIANILHVPTQNRDNRVLTRTLHYAAFILQRNSEFKYPGVSKRVIQSERVQNAIEETAAEELSELGLDNIHLMPLRQKHRKRAIEILKQMRSCISSLLLRISGWVIYKILGRILSSIYVHKGQIEALRKVSGNNVPLIYLPLHRSHLDYILVTFILYINDLRAPLVAAGDNLLITFFGVLMRGLGAFFIKRKLDPQKGKKDRVYRAILHTYMSESMREGHSLEFFIEGGRTRTGKASLPKAGLLSVIVDTVNEGIVEDAYIVPVGISYEKIMDGNFVLEQLGKPKIMEDFKHAVKAVWHILHSNFGSVRVDFCQPFSLREFLNSYKKFQINLSPRSLVSIDRPLRSTPTSGLLYGTDIVVEDYRQVVKALAEHVVYDAFHTTALMSSNLLAFLYLTKHRKGATFQQLCQSLTWLRGEIIDRKRDVGFTGESSNIIRHASTLLTKDLVTIETTEMAWSSEKENNNIRIVFHKPIIRLPHVLELQYYSNSVVSVFLSESIVANALYAIVDKNLDSWRGCDSRFFVSREQLVNKALMLCDVLQYEFIFTPPCGDLFSFINEAVDHLLSNEILSQSQMVARVEDHMEQAWMNRVASHVDWEESSESEDDLIVIQDQLLQVMLSEESLDTLQFYRCILSPYVESYWLAASSLLKLVQVEKEESVFLKEIHKTAEERLHQGLIVYEECFAADQLKNAVKLFEHWKVVECYTQDSVKLYYLSSGYNSEEAINEIIRKIEEYKV